MVLETDAVRTNSITEDTGMKAKKKMLTAATLSAFLALAGAVQAQNTGGDKNRIRASGKKATHYRRVHRSGKKSHKRHRRSNRKSGGTTPPPK